MNVLLLGANGFIGGHLEIVLTAAGHNVRRGIQQTNCAFANNTILVDYCHDHAIVDWLPQLNGIDAVINAVGILRETPTHHFDDIHIKAPQALFAACATAQVRRVIQISALGADENAVSRYHLSKKAADDFLAKLDLDWVIVQPSIVYGHDGISSRMFCTLASLPWLPLPGQGKQLLQPIHVDDLCSCMVTLVNEPSLRHQRLALVGPIAIHYQDYLASLRQQLGLPPPRLLPIPLPLLRLTARLTQWLPRHPLTPETLAMLERGNCASVKQTRCLLGRGPLPVSCFIPPTETDSLRQQAQLDWLLPLMKASLAVLWLASGIVSLGIYPIQDSLDLLARIGFTVLPTTAVLYGLASMDILLGLLTWLWPGRRLWQLQLFIVIGYSLVIAFLLPEFLVHPFMPIGKNLPIIALLILLLVVEQTP